MITYLTRLHLVGYCLYSFTCDKPPDHSSTESLSSSLHEAKMTIRPDPKPWIVQKYGGTSLGKLLDKVCGTIIPSYLKTYNVAVVCSALSGTTKASGTTSLLLDCLRCAEIVGVESIGHINATIDSIRDAHLDKLQSFQAYSNDTSDLLLSETTLGVVNDCEEIRRFLLAAHVRLGSKEQWSQSVLLCTNGFAVPPGRGRSVCTLQRPRALIRREIGVQDRGGCVDHQGGHSCSSHQPG